MCFVADGYCTVYEETTIKKSRKQHKCSDCFGVIPVGSHYTSMFTVFEGNADTFKICDRCYSLRKGIVLVEIAEGCHSSEAEPLLGAMFDQLGESEGATHYYHKLMELGRLEDAQWLAKNSRIDEPYTADGTPLGEVLNDGIKSIMDRLEGSK